MVTVNVSSVWLKQRGYGGVLVASMFCLLYVSLFGVCCMVYVFLFFWCLVFGVCFCFV